MLRTSSYGWLHVKATCPFVVLSQSVHLQITRIKAVAVFMQAACILEQHGCNLTCYHEMSYMEQAFTKCEGSLTGHVLLWQVHLNR